MDEIRDIKSDEDLVKKEIETSHLRHQAGGASALSPRGRPSGQRADLQVAREHGLHLRAQEPQGRGAGQAPLRHALHESRRGDDGPRRRGPARSHRRGHDPAHGGLRPAFGHPGRLRLRRRRSRHGGHRRHGLPHGRAPPREGGVLRGRPREGPRELRRGSDRDPRRTPSRRFVRSSTCPTSRASTPGPSTTSTSRRPAAPARGCCRSPCRSSSPSISTTRTRGCTSCWAGT